MPSRQASRPAARSGSNRRGDAVAERPHASGPDHSGSARGDNPYLAHGQQFAPPSGVFKVVAPELERLAELRLLVGNVTDQQTMEQLAQTHTAARLIERERTREFANQVERTWDHAESWSTVAPAYLLALANSSVLDTAWKHLNTPLRGGFYRYFTQFVEQLPIRLLDLELASERAEQDALVGMVERILAAKRASPKANLRGREIERAEVEAAIREPSRREPARPPREVVSRSYFDKVTGTTMLLRLVIEETVSEIAVVTLYRTSKVRKYLPEGQP